MSTLGTRCAICLELRCQLEKMSFFTPELTQKEPERKKKKKYPGASGALGGSSGMACKGCSGTAAEPPRRWLGQSHRCYQPHTRLGVVPRLAVGPSNEHAWVSSKPWSGSPGPPIQALAPGPTGCSDCHPLLPCNFSPISTRFQTPQKFFWAQL